MKGKLSGCREAPAFFIAILVGLNPLKDYDE